MAIRNNVNEFVTAVQAGGHAVAQQKNNVMKVTTASGVVHPRVFWLSGGAITDANPRGDRVLVEYADGTRGFADAEQYLRSLK